MMKASRLVKILFAAALVFAFALPAMAADYTIKVGTIVSESHPDYICMKDVFKPYVEKNSNGKIKVELYPNAQLGGDREMSESVQLGTIQMTIPAVAVLSGFEPKFQVFDLPFLFKDKQAAYKALDGELGKKIDALLPPLGMINLGYGENGYRHITNNRGPITKPDDLKGLKIRCMENPVHVATFKRMGANPTPMSFSELYTALAQKTVDAQENPINLVYSSKFYEVQKFYSLTGHLYAVVPLVVSDKWFQGLPKDMQAVVLDGGRLYQKRERAINEKQEKGMLDEMKKKGLQVNVLTADQKKAFVTATLPIYDQFKDRIGADMVELAKKANQ